MRIDRPTIADINGYTTTATAAGTTTLDVNSTFLQVFTGTTTQIIVMPVTSTLVLGRRWKIINASTGILTINSSGNNLITTIAPGWTVEIICISISGTTAASWLTVLNAGDLMFASSDETTAITTGTAKITGNWAWNFTALTVFIGLSTNSSSGAVTVDFNDKNGTSIFSTRPSILANEQTSLTNGTQPVMSTTAFVRGDKWTLDIDAAGTGAAGIKFYMVGNKY
jgi:hypothetical protein